MTIHSIVSVDFDHFHQQFLFPFLTEATVLADPQKQALIDGFSTERDLPTFKTNVQARATTHPVCCTLVPPLLTVAGLRRAGLRARLLLLRLPGRRGRVGAQLSGAGMGRPRAIQHGLGSSFFLFHLPFLVLLGCIDRDCSCSAKAQGPSGRCHMFPGHGAVVRWK